MRKRCLLFFLAVTCLNLQAQEKRTLDSLKNLFAKAKPDTSKVRLYALITFQYTWSYPDSALMFAEAGIRLAEKLHFKKGKGDILIQRNYALLVRGNFPKALSASIESLKQAQANNDSTNVFHSLELIGDVYKHSHDYGNALIYYRKCRSYLAEDRIKNEHEPLLEHDIGELFFDENQLDSALFHSEKAYAIDSIRKAVWPPPLIDLAKIYNRLGNYKKARYFGLKAAQISQFQQDQADAYTVLADVYNSSGRPDSSIYYAKKALNLSLATSFSLDVPEVAGLLTSLYKVKKMPDSALKFEDIMVAARERMYSREKTVEMQNIDFKEQQRQQSIREKEAQYQSDMKMYALLSALAVFLVIAAILWRSNKHKKTANAQIQKTLSDLKSTQSQLIQREKMASLGELTAGIAHEIQNPLNFVNNFSEVNAELIEEMEQEIEKGDLVEVKAIADDIKTNQQKISQHGKRADFIVKGMLQHSRTSTGEKQLTNMNVLCDEFLKLSYHGLRAKDKSFNAEMSTHFDPNLPKVNVSQQDMGRVMLNLFNNAFYAVNQKAKTAGADYKPMVEVSTAHQNGSVIVKVKDNGTGIPENIREKIMQPFFTTKPTGEGTGLGLSLTYDMVVKGHGGSIDMNTKEGEFTEFIIKIPA